MKITKQIMDGHSKFNQGQTFTETELFLVQYIIMVWLW